MKKIIKKILACAFLLTGISFAYTVGDCTKLFSKDADTVFLSALSALNLSPKVEISEIQTKNGYILFICNSKYYLLTVTKRYQNQTEVKILPADSEFDSFNIAPEIFNAIQNNLLWSN